MISALLLGALTPMPSPKQELSLPSASLWNHNAPHTRFSTHSPNDSPIVGLSLFGQNLCV